MLTWLGPRTYSTLCSFKNSSSWQKAAERRVYRAKSSYYSFLCSVGPKKHWLEHILKEAEIQKLLSFQKFSFSFLLAVTVANFYLRKTHFRNFVIITNHRRVVCVPGVLGLRENSSNHGVVQWFDLNRQNDVIWRENCERVFMKWFTK